MQSRSFFGPVNLLLVGDSWTDDAYSHGQYAANWPGGLVVVNEGTAAQTVQSVAATIAADLAANPSTDICVVCSGGINDVATRTNVQIQNDVIACYDAIVAADAQAVIVGIPRSSAWTGNGFNDRVDDIEDYLSAYFAARGVPFVALKPLVSNDSGILSEYAEDAIHLNENGAAVLAQAILGPIKVSKWRKKAVA